jgi:hypothetical protein
MTDEPERLDAPNQQVVRPDGSGPADEGDGAGKATKATREAAKEAAKEADEAADPKPDPKPATPARRR